MKFWFFFLFSFFFFNSNFGQTPVDANGFLGLTTITTADRLVSVGNPGSLVYDTDLNRIFQYTAGVGWQELFTTNSTVYVGAFVISGAGPINVSGIPFAPTAVSFVAHANVENFNNINSDNAERNNAPGIENSFGTMNGIARNDTGPPFFQRTIYLGASGNSINDISRYSSNVNCIGVRYSNQNGNILGLITGRVTAFTTDGFSLDITYASGVPAAEGLAVLYTAYR